MNACETSHVILQCHKTRTAVVAISHSQMLYFRMTPQDPQHAFVMNDAGQLLHQDH